MNPFRLFFIVFVLSCHTKGNHPFFFNPSEMGDTPDFFFEYGSIGTPIETDKPNEFTHYQNGILCVFSIPIQLYNQELGAKFRICWKTDEKSAVRIQNGFTHLESKETEYLPFLEKGKDWNLSLSELGKWKGTHDPFPPILEWKNQIWSSGIVTYQTFAIPHPRFVQTKEFECEVIFRSYVLDVSENKTPILVFQFPCPNPDSILKTILSQNQTWFLQCETESPVVSELFRHSESSYQRFMEWQNPNDFVLCPSAKSIVREKEGEFTNFQSEEFLKRSRLILPHGILLFSDDPRFQGIPIPKTFVSELGTREGFQFGNSFYDDLPFSFHQGENFFSIQTDSTSCRDQLNIWKTEQTFCGNPGLPNMLEKIPAKEQINGCTPTQIKLTEFYPGNHKETNFPLPPFFEFQNQGDDCDVSSLNWILDGAIYPFSAKEEILKQEEIILFTRERWLGWNLLERVKPFSIPKVTFQIPNFVIQNRKSKESIPYEPNANRFHLLRKGNQNIISIYSDGLEIPHPKSNSDENLQVFGFQLSPGKHQKTEIHWIGSKLLEFAKNPYPFFDFGFLELEEGIGAFQTEDQKEYFYWKPRALNLLSFAYGPSVCNGENLYHLPAGFFSDQFNSLTYKDQVTSAFVESRWSEDSLNEKSFGETRSLHPETSPIDFSSSVFPSPHCPGLWRSPGSEKHRSLELRKLTPEESYHSNLILDSFLEVQYGNLRQIFHVPIHFLSHLSFQLNLSSVILEHSEEQIYSYFSHPMLIEPIGFLEKKGPVQIEAIFPNPNAPQNEWIYICNRSMNPEDISQYFIEDETSSDQIVPYQTRFPGTNPKAKNGYGFVTNDTILWQGTCAWIVDPDGSDWYVPIFHSESDRLFTVISTQTIGNGISSGESIQLRKRVNGETILISSFGHKESASPFRKYVNSGEYLWLKKNSDGTKSEDFEIYREEN
ncbi:LIC11755 family lipoprotein [Leptospira biflexa]|uniref:LIC11755 family lipoprotein n=1 Tax=Leptospira biflexa TaxID=172 RepID=UPI0010846C2F|nr:hypothetical protein [Leptospira biflexa]TGM31669.1 hypothetical protein EHQ89_16850 [Leptospira biflexa]TGM39171.1 hypothetical protein EHQ80_04260 [Leptospira biflexa]TGM53929.1 hypothetical protein EHQ91_02710 [Leptospira biflexa]